MIMTATSWVRCLYRFPPLIKQAWLYWKGYDQNSTTVYAEVLLTLLPRNWKNTPDIWGNIIKACPFCSQNNSINRKKGTLEHLHLYCQSIYLRRV